MRSNVLLVLLGVAIAPRINAQDPVPAPAPTVGESVTAMVPPHTPAPNPLQDRYLHGLRTASRGVAQIKDGINRVVRTQSTKDTAQVRQAAKRLGALCGAARGFIVNGRGQMEPNAYAPPTRKPARDLTVQLDSLVISAKTCQASATKSPTPVTTDLLARLRGYESAVATFRTAIGLPNRQ